MADQYGILDPIDRDFLSPPSDQDITPAQQDQGATPTRQARSRDPVDTFISNTRPTAQRVGQQIGVDPDILIGQWGHETGWGKSVVPGTNNLGNIKDFSGGGTAATDNMTGSRDRYRAYENQEAFGTDYAGLIERNYQGALNAGGDAYKYASELKRGGYAEDPNYVTKLGRAVDTVRARSGGGSSLQPFIAPIPGGMAQDQYLSPEDAAFMSLPEAKKEKGFLGHAATGFKTAFQQLPELGWGLAGITSAAVENIFGEGGMATAAKKFAVAKAADWGKSIAEDTNEDYDVTTAWAKARDNGDFGALANWLGYGVGYAAAQVGQVLGTAGVGKLAVQAAAKPAVERFLAGQVARRTAELEAQAVAKRGVLSEVQKQAIQRTAVSDIAGQLGEHAGIAAFGFGMEGGEIGGDLARQSVEEGKALTGAQLGRALGATILAGGMEYGESLLGLKALKGKLPTPFGSTAGGAGRIARGVTGAAAAAPFEAATEFAQTGVEEYGKGTEESILPTSQSPEHLEQAINAAALGGLAGGLAGGVGGVASRPAPPVRKPNSPFTNATAGEAPAPGPEAGGPGTGKLAPGTSLPGPGGGPGGTGIPPSAEVQAMRDEEARAAAGGAPEVGEAGFGERLAHVRSALDRDTMQRIRADQNFGPDSLDQILRGMAVARNPSVDPRVREDALRGAEDLLTNFQVTRWQQGRPDAVAPGTELAPFQAPGVPATRGRGPTTVEGEVIPEQAQLEQQRLLGAPNSLNEQGFLDLLAAPEGQRQLEERPGQPQLAPPAAEPGAFISGPEGTRPAMAGDIGQGAAQAARDEEIARAAEERETRMGQGLDVRTAATRRARIQEIQDAVASGAVTGFAQNNEALVNPETGTRMALLTGAERAVARAALERRNRNAQEVRSDTGLDRAAAASEGRDAEQGGVGQGPGDRGGNIQQDAETGRGAGNREAQEEVTAPVSAVDEGAHEAASSSQNELTPPTSAQIEAGTAKLGHAKISGVNISFENPDQSIRSNLTLRTDQIDAAAEKAYADPKVAAGFRNAAQLVREGKAKEALSSLKKMKRWAWEARDEIDEITSGAWATRMEGAHYGYARGVAARSPDKEHVDVFVKAGTPESYAGPVFVIDQNKPNGTFDEPKVMVGYATEQEARTGYLKHYPRGQSKNIRAITPLSWDEFKNRLEDPHGFDKPQTPGATAAQPEERRAPPPPIETEQRSGEDRRQVDEPVAEERRTRPRRGLTPDQQRAAFQMLSQEGRADLRAALQKKSHEELIDEFMQLLSGTLENPLTGLPNRLAYDARATAGQRLARQASIDLDDFKGINDKFGHDGGDQALIAFGEILADEGQKMGLPVYHTSGDEFRAEADTDTQLRDMLNRARDRARTEVQVQVTKPDGTTDSATGIGASYGLGATFAAADEQLGADKAARKAAGLRKGARDKPTVEAGAGGIEGAVQPEREAGAAQAPAKVATPPAEPAPTTRNVRPARPENLESEHLLTIIRRLGGINSAEALDLTGEGSAVANRTHPTLFRKKGMGLDDLVRALYDRGFVQINTEDVDGGVAQLREMIGEALSGTRIYAPEIEYQLRSEQERRDEILRKAEELGIKTSKRKFSNIERDALAILDERQQQEEATLDREAQKDLEALKEELRTLALDADDEIERAAVATKGRGAQEFVDLLKSQLRHRINARYNEINAELTLTADEQRAEQIDFGDIDEQGEGLDQGGSTAHERNAEEAARETGGVSGERGGAGDRDEDGAAQPETENFELTGETEQEIRQREEAVRADKERRHQEEDAEEKRRKADLERNDFILTGSDRPADVNPNQGNLLQPRSQYGDTGPEQVTSDETPRAEQRARRDAYTVDLFENPLPASPAVRPTVGKQPAPATIGNIYAAGQVPGSVFATVAGPTRTGTLKSAYEKVETAQEAAHTLAGLRKSPQERFFVLVLDAERKPIAVLRLFAGATTATGVYTEVVTKAVYEVPGAAHIWYAHNHPSGTARPSTADEALTKTLSQAFGPGTGVTVDGHIVIAGTKAAPMDADGSPAGPAFDIRPALRRHTVPITERIFRKVGKLADAIGGPTEAKQLIPEIAGAKTGIVFANTNNEPVGFLPMSAQQMRLLRDANEPGENSGARILFGAAARANAASAFINFGEDTASLDIARVSATNIYNALASRDVRVLDAFRNGESFAERGLLGDQGRRGVFFSMPGSISDDFDAYMQAQANWLDDRARDAGFENADDMVAKDPKAFNELAASWREIAGSGETVETIRKALVDRFGADGIRALEENGILSLVTFNEAPAHLRRAGAEAVYDGNGHAYIFVDRISAVRAPGSLVHELGEHFGLRSMLGESGWSALASRLVTLAKSKGSPVGQVWRAVKAQYPEFSGASDESLSGNDHFLHEVVARIGETAGLRKSGIWQRIVAAVRAFLLKLGFSRGINEDSIADIVDGSLRRVMRLAGREQIERNLPREPLQGRGASALMGENPMFSMAPTQPGSTGAVREWFKPEDEIPETAPAWTQGDDITDEVRSALRKVSIIAPEKTWRQRLSDFMTDAGKRFVQSTVDQYAPLKELDYRSYMLARMSNSSDQGLEALLLYGKPFLQDGALNATIDQDGGLVKVLAQLQDEHDRFFAWIAGNRAAQLKAEGRENLFTDEDISALRTLNAGEMPDGTSRSQLYDKVLKRFNGYGKAVLDIAQEAGLIDPESRAVWESDFYVPFYRNMEAGTSGPSVKSGLVNQYAFKTLRGGRDNIKDLFANTLQNWSHLLSASLKNQAAREALTKAADIGAALEVPNADIVKDMNLKTKVVRVLDSGATRYFTIEDPFLLDAVSALEARNASGVAMQTLRKFKHFLTMGVTANPAFKIRNLIRDTISAMGTSDVSYNPLNSLAEGWKATKHDTETRASLLASGAIFRYGNLFDGGGQAGRVKRMVEAAIGPDAVLDTESKLKAGVQKLWNWYQEQGDRTENVNRAAIYQRAREKGKSHLEAAYEARDLMDFSLQGTARAVRFLAEVVPFFNARLQGLYKLGRAYKDDPKRLGYVMGATTLATLALMLAYKDDEDWKQLDDAMRNNYWFFKIGDKMFAIPKPFEIGAVASAVERVTEYAISNEERAGRRLGQNLWDLVANQLSMNPTPQLFKPLADIYANRDSFTGRQIESAALENLPKGERATPRTSGTAMVIGRLGLPNPLELASGRYSQISPVQADFLLRGYFGWLGTMATTAIDYGISPITDRPAKPTPTLRDVFLVGNFVQSLPAGSSRYVTEFYDQAKEVEQAYASYRDALRTGQPEKAEQVARERGEEITHHTRIGRIKRALGQLSQEEHRVMLDRVMVPDEKRERLDVLAEERKRLVAPGNR